MLGCETLKSKLYMINILILLLLSAHIPDPVYASPDEATWQQKGDTRGYWFGCGSVWGWLRFYPYFIGQTFTMSIWRNSTPSDMIALKFSNGIMYYWDKDIDDWTNAHSYPSGLWLEVILESNEGLFTFSLFYGDTDIEITSFHLLMGDNYYDEAVRLGFDGDEDIFVYEISFTDGQIAFDYTEFVCKHHLIDFPRITFVLEEFSNENYTNWDFSNVTCDAEYISMSGKDIGKFWTTVTSPSDPSDAPIEKEWWEKARDRAWDILQSTWRSLASFLPGEFVDALNSLWQWLNWGWCLITDLWLIVVANIPAISTIIVVGYIFGLIDAIRSSELNSIQDAIVSPIKMLMRLMQTIAGILQTIWGFIKFW